MRFILIAAALTAATACQRIHEPEQMSAGCEARAAQTWNAAGADYNVEAVSTGPDCDRAIATIVIRDSSGVPLYAEAHLATHIMTLAPAQDAAAMRTALGEWTTSTNSTMATTSALPDWPENAQGPESGEFPFYPEADYDRASYMTLRQNNLPLFCYVQGMESLACLALDDGQLTKVGVQTFPG
jgi:hypothetical protein